MRVVEFTGQQLTTLAWLNDNVLEGRGCAIIEPTRSPARDRNGFLEVEFGGDVRYLIRNDGKLFEPKGRDFVGTRNPAEGS